VASYDLWARRRSADKQIRQTNPIHPADRPAIADCGFKAVHGWEARVEMTNEPNWARVGTCDAGPVTTEVDVNV
jgi:hypothetical protein